MGRSKKWDKTWKQLVPDVQDLYLSLLWRDGFSEKAITDFFRTTKGRIVRRRHTLRLPSSRRGKIKSWVEYEHFLNLLEIHKMETVEKETGVICIAPIEDAEQEADTEPEEAPDEIAEEIARPEPEAPALVPIPGSRTLQKRPDGPDEQRTASRRKPKYQLTTDWRLQCVHRDNDGLRCSYVQEPDSEFCKLHGG